MPLPSRLIHIFISSFPVRCNSKRGRFVVNMGVMAWGHTLTHLQCTFVTSTEISVNLPRSLVNGELGMARTHFKTVTLGVIAVLFTYLFLVTQKTTHTPVSYPYAGITGYMGWFITGGVILLFFTHNSVIQTIFFGGLILVQQPP